MTKMHLSDGQERKCEAKTPEACPVRENGERVPHFRTKVEARDYIAALAESENPNHLANSTQRKNQQEDVETSDSVGDNVSESANNVTEDSDSLSEDAENVIEVADNEENGDGIDRPIKYSFVTEFKKLEEQFEHDFEGVPTRFFNADLRGKRLASMPEAHQDLESVLENFNQTGEVPQFFSTREKESVMAARLAQAMSAPTDLAMAEDDIKRSLRELGESDDLREVADSYVLRAFKTEKAWVANIGGRNTIITSAGQASKNFQRYALRSSSDDVPRGYNMVVDTRMLAGLTRIKRKTDHNLVALASNSFDKLPAVQAGHEMVADNWDKSTENEFERENRRLEALRKANLMRSNVKQMAIVSAIVDLEAAQREGNNFKAQKRHVMESGQTVASAWQDKKHYKKSHIEAAKASILNKHFDKIDLDDDVDLEEFKDFEKAYLEVADKLPSMNGRKPRLGVRKLGKHRADGLYAPSAGSNGCVLVDVHASSSFIHEYGHHIDLTVNNNSSLRKDFANIQRQYARNLKLPENHSGRKELYYQTATEVHSRLFEIYSYERLGIRNRLVDPSRFDNFDYAPIQNNPKLKEEGFAFLDKVFAENN